MNIRLIGADGSILNLPNNWGIENIPYTTRNRGEEAVFLDGARNVGTNRYNSAKIKLFGLYKYIVGSPTHGKTVDDYISGVMAFIRDKGPVKVYEIGLGRDDRYLDECYLENVQPDTFRRSDFAKYSINLLVMNPFWLEPEPGYSGTINDKDEFTLTNNGDYETYPVFTITATNPNPLLRLINKSDFNRRCEVAYSFFDVGPDMEIDAYNNTILFGDLNISEFGNGNFIRLLVGNNVIKYTGNTVDIAVSWLKRRTY